MLSYAGISVLHKFLNPVIIDIFPLHGEHYVVRMGEYDTVYE